MAGPAFDALAAKGVKVLVGGVAPSGGRKADDNLAFYDNTPRVFALHKAMSTPRDRRRRRRRPTSCGCA